MRYIYSYLEKRKQCVHINSTTSSFKYILSGASHKSILGPTFFNLLFNDFLFCILIASPHNFADDNRLIYFAVTVEDVIEPLQSECKVAMEWLIENKLFVNPNKFQAILLDKQKSDYTGTKITVGSEEIHVVSSVDVLGVTIDDKLNLNLHIDRICKSALKSNRLNALISVKNCLGSEERKVLINSFLLSSFNYFPLV